MDYSIKKRRASDGYQLHYRHWYIEEQPRGWILMLHGIQSHSGWYEYSCGQLAHDGFDVRSVDRRGSGRNNGVRGHVPHWTRVLNDVRHNLRDIEIERRKYDNPGPVILMAVSWGAKLAATIIQSGIFQPDALVLVTPAIFSRIEPSIVDNTRLHLAEKLGIHKRLVDIPLNDPELFTSDPHWQDFIRQDKLALHQVTTSFLFANRHFDQVARQPKSLNLPVQLMLARNDQIIDNDRTEQFVRHITNGTCDVIEYDDARHTLELDHSRQQFVNDLKKWISDKRPL